MTAPTLAPPVRIARAAVFAVFGLNGFLSAMWVVHIPVVTERTGVSNATLGMLILLMAGGAIIGMQAAGPLADRFGSRALVAAAASWLALAVIGPGFATGPVALAFALVAYGFGNGAVDVSMNAQAVQVERAYGRPIMGAFHALFSCGGLVGSLAGAAALHSGWDIRLTFVVTAIGGLLTVAVSAPRFLSHVKARSEVPAAVDASPRTPRAHVSRKVFALAAIAFALLMTEGVANDWSALQLREHLGASEATAALAFGAFSTTMTIGRFGADRVSGRFGAVAVVRWGALLGAAGLTLIITSAWVPLTLLGWALLGLGLAGGIPQIFSAAGNLGTATAATDMSRVFSLGYLGFLAGPSVIGWLSKPTSLTVALIFPLIAVLLCAWFAKIVDTRS
ncbi:MFS transporter [Nocardia transvalensis]|uniref:MFS transporter n=1 Tax=Nocardia transvalensis TaxID=37333 RepID=UPI0018945E36|nr:MFS transporter [Nocardia transvalensis]MBF6334065.1 MFS transporter [Nocardia transvalensis]